MSPVSYGIHTERITMSTTGFMSARQHLQEVKAYEESSFKKREESAAPRNDSNKVLKQTQGRKKVEIGQKSIMSFVKKSTETTTPQISMTERRLFDTRMNTKQSFQSRGQPPQKNSALTHEAIAPPNVLRRLPKQSSFQRPRGNTEPEEVEPIRHILLSSSPTKPDSSTNPGTTLRMSKQDARSEKENNEGGFEGTGSSYVGFVKSSTLHETSMQKLTAAGSQLRMKKTFGVRPSANGCYNPQYRNPTFR
jgi:hypothetical protein